MSNIIPVPVTFNPYKHHFNFINQQIQIWKKSEWEYVEPSIRKIGSNLIDLYLEKLTITDICNECVDYLNNENALKKKHFLEWLKPSGYKKTELSDNSKWILKKADDRERYIHIHPAKNSENTIRVRGTTLKTIIAIKVLKHADGGNLLSLDNVNSIRTDYLGFSPVKSIQHGKGISRLWQLFNLR